MPKDERELMRLKQRFETARSNRDIVKGQLESVHGTLKKRYKIESVAKAEKLLSRKRKQIEAKERKLREGIEELRKVLES